MTDKEQLPTVEVVYMGRRLGRDGKWCLLLIAHDFLKTFAAESDWFRDPVEAAASPFADFKGSPRLTVGAIYQVEAAVEDRHLKRIRFGTMKLVGPSNHPLVATWREAERAGRTKKQAEKEAEKAAKETALDRALDVVADHYKKVSPGNKMAFQLMILNRLFK